MLKLSELPISRAELELKARETLLELLSRVPGACVEGVLGAHHSSDLGFDFVLSLSTKYGQERLLCEVKSRAYVSELHAVAHRLGKKAATDDGRRIVPVFIAPYLSKQAAQTCSELGLSWADLAGNCELRFEGSFIHIEGCPNPYKQGRGTSSLYTPRSAQIVHALLLRPHKPWKTDELVQAAHASAGQVASVKKLLEANGWLRKGYGETKLSEPRKLLEDWSAHYKPHRKTHRFFTLDTPSQLEARLAERLDDAALTEFSAAERYAPYTRHQRVAFYVPEWSDSNAKHLSLKGGDGASNVVVYETGEPLLFTEHLRGVRCASPITAYLDLLQLAGRGQDAAQHLLEATILPRWE